MIIGIGIHCIDIPSIQSALTREDKSFLFQVFTPDEQGYCFEQSKPELHLAARYAAKEAVLKVLSLGEREGIKCTDIAIRTGPSGAPYLELTGMALAYERSLMIRRWHLSLTHTDHWAAAFVIAEGVEEYAPDYRD